jgi:putative addiction module killer protein
MRLAIREFLTPEGKSPFREWLDTLDLTVRARIQARVFRFELGDLGDRKAVGGGVWEARLTFGPGYRVYFARDGRTIILLLLGGNKASQAKDIRRAQQFWMDYLEARRHGTAQ